jgi:murein L,D-transpeptidase YafK
MLRRLLSVFGPASTILAIALLVLTPVPVAAAGREPEARRVTRILIKKKEHTIQLLSGPTGSEEMVVSYKVAIGPGGSGPKRREGDRVTPVGRYHVTMHQPSQFKIFLRLDYPNAEDHRRFAALKRSGELPPEAKIGSDIGIHGPPVSLEADLKSGLKDFDWTLGCIALNDDEISEVARLVRDGTIVDIED